MVRFVSTDRLSCRLRRTSSRDPATRDGRDFAFAGDTTGTPAIPGAGRFTLENSHLHLLVVACR